MPDLSNDQAFDPEFLKTAAQRHGVDLGDVQPFTHEDRLQRLRQTLDNQQVRFPIAPEIAADYFARARAGLPFTVGALSQQTVDLAEYANEQHYDRYTLAEHLSWACLIADQQRSKTKFACKEYLSGEELFEIGGTVIPDFFDLNARIYQQTGWQLATVNMIIPAELFFTCHSLRFFPVTTFMRPLEQDYLQEPDIGHDVAGHVATFTIPTVAAVMQQHGDARNMIYQERDKLIAETNDEQVQEQAVNRADELLRYAERIYWFTVEFGLVLQDEELRGYGAGILSSPGETTYSIESPTPSRIIIDPQRDEHLMRLVRTAYMISEYQKTYFVTESFEQLASLTADRIVAACKRAVDLEHYSWRDLVPGDRVWSVGEVATSVEEKYLRFDAGKSHDTCEAEVAERNRRLLVNKSN